MLKRLRYVLMSVVLAVSFGCAFAPVKQEIPHLGGDLSVKSSAPGQAKLVFFNNSSKLLFPLTGRMNVSLNGKGVSALEIGQYVQVSVPKGRHSLELSHWDMFDFKSSHELSVEEDVQYVEVAATIVSNEFKVHKQLPEKSALPAPFVAVPVK